VGVVCQSKSPPPVLINVAVTKVNSLKKISLLVLGMLAVLFVSACSPPPPLRDANLLQDDSLITDRPCSAPCWNGITPGETEWNDALTILEDSTQLENVQTAADEESSAVAAEFQGVGGIACCQMVSSGGEIVDAVFLRLSPDLTVEELLDAKGEPAYAIADIFTEDQAIVNLIYPELNTVIYAFVAGAEAELTETSEIIGVLYVNSSDMQAIIDTSNLHAWDGYATYATYSRENEEFEVTPSVTLTPTPQ
jgi:hypothetical protein